MAKDVAKNVAKGFAKSTKALRACASWTAHIGVNARVTVLVVSRTFLRVRQHFVGFFAFFEFDLGFFGRVALIAVRVKLHRQFAIGFFDFFVAGVFGNAKHFIKISFGHGVLLNAKKDDSASDGVPEVDVVHRESGA